MVAWFRMSATALHVQMCRAVCQRQLSFLYDIGLRLSAVVIQRTHSAVVHCHLPFTRGSVFDPVPGLGSGHLSTSVMPLIHCVYRLSAWQFCPIEASILVIYRLSTGGRTLSHCAALQSVFIWWVIDAWTREIYQRHNLFTFKDMT